MNTEIPRSSAPCTGSRGKSAEGMSCHSQFEGLEKGKRGREVGEGERTGKEEGKKKWK